MVFSNFSNRIIKVVTSTYLYKDAMKIRNASCQVLNLVCSLLNEPESN